MAFPQIYSDESCPLDGYAGYVFRVLLNPSGATKDDWAFGNLGVDGCEKCAQLRTPPRGKPRAAAAIARSDDGTVTTTERTYCPECTRARDRFGRAAVAIYGTSHVDGFNFTTPETAIETFTAPDLPDELLTWIYILPASLWQKRTDDLKKRLSISYPVTNGVSSEG